MPKNHRANDFNYQTQGGNPLSSQLQGCSENKGFRMTTDGETEAVSGCSSSLLFSQLRFVKNYNVDLLCSYSNFYFPLGLQSFCGRTS